MPRYDLGISAFYHDSAVTLIKDGLPVAAAQEERFTRIRHDSSFPINALKFCLDNEKISLRDLDTISYYEDPKIKFKRVIASFINAGPRSIEKFIEVMPEWVSYKRNITKLISKQLIDEFGIENNMPIQIVSHHRSHASSAFFPSPFENAAVLCIDSVGEWQTTSIWHGNKNDLNYINSISYPHSLGFLYSAFTYYCGFKVDSGEYKLMGLAPYGVPRYKDLILDNLIDLKKDGSFSLNLKYFEFIRGKRMIGSKFEFLLGGATRSPESEITQRECDLAASIQSVITTAVLNLAKAAHKLTGSTNLCLAGGVALNCVANGELSRASIFSNLWIQPAAGDAGGSLGAALHQSVKKLGRKNYSNETYYDSMQGALLGSEYSDDEIRVFLEKYKYSFKKLKKPDLYKKIARHLSNGKVIGWFQNKMEFGPRALGSRSILGDPRNLEMQKTLNLKIKYRESFRPFAPSVLKKYAKEYFNLSQESPYMLLVSEVSESIQEKNFLKKGFGTINEVRSKLPAITHVDMSARVQTVTHDRAPEYALLLESFYSETGCPVLVNTSFNVRGEPIVRTPKEAFACFMRTEMDILVLGSFVLIKSQQEQIEDNSWRDEIPLD